MEKAREYKFIQGLRSDRTFFFSSGSTAIYALLRSMGLVPGEEVLVQGFTCTSVPYSVIEASAVPVYVDIDPVTLNIDPAKLEEKITGKTRAIIIQHTFGVPAEINSLLEICRRHNLWVIEDACHSFGSKYEAREVGTFGDASIYSFGWHKPISLGRGGAVVINNDELLSFLQQQYTAYIPPTNKTLVELNLKYFAYNLFYSPSRFWSMKEMYRRMRDFATGPRKGSLEALFRGQSSQATGMNISELEEIYQHELEDSRAGAILAEQTGQSREGTMAPIEQRRLFAKLADWDKVVLHQKRIVTYYIESLARAGFELPEISSGLEPVYYKYPVLVDSDAKRDILNNAVASGVEMSDMFGSPLAPMERALQWKVLGYRQGMCPVTENISARIIALPVHLRVQAAQIDQVVSLLRSLKRK